MNRIELIDRIAARSRSRLSKADIERILLASLDEIIECVREGKNVTLTGFGTFRSVENAERIGRNPATGERVMIPAKRKPKFVASAAFKEALKD